MNAITALLWLLAQGQSPAPAAAATEPAKPPAATAAAAPSSTQDAGAARSQLNLRNQTDTASGESRRNENVNFNPIDNNAAREVNLRLGATATVVGQFDPARNYFSAELGARPAAVLHVTPGRTAIAARAIHGSVHATHHNSVFSARSFFQAGPVRPARENNYGFNVTAPLWRGASVSLDASQQKARGNVNGNVLVPNANERTPLTTDPLIRPLVARYLAAYPTELPNRTDIDDRALNTNSPQRIDTNRIGTGIDQSLGKRNRLFLRYSLTAQDTKAFQLVAGQNPDSNVRSHNARATWNHTFSPSTILDVSTGFDRLGTVLRPEANAVTPFLSIFIIQRQGSLAIPVDRAVNEFRQAAHLRHARSKHVISAGASLLRRQFNGQEANDHLGTFYFGDAFGRDAVGNLRMGTPFRFTIAVGNTARGYRNWDSASYVSDSWSVTSRFTMQTGLRYETFSRPVEVNGRDSLPFSCDCNNLAPTLGLAYQLPGRAGVMRAAYGIHYGRIFPATYGQSRFNPPGVFSLNVDNPNLANPLQGLDLTAGFPPGTRTGITSISPDLVSPYSHQYNFSWEPAPLPSNIRLQLGYVGSRTHKLLTIWSMNRAKAVDGIPQTTATVNQRRPDPRYFGVQRSSNGAMAWYDAARVSLVVPERRGWSFDASYWFSKSIDLGSDYTATGAGFITPSQSDLSIHEDVKAVSNFHQPHALLTRASYEVPRAMPRVLRGWRTSAVLLMKTGTPFSVFSGSDAPGFGNVDGESGDRVDILDPSILGRTVGDPDTSRSLLPRSAFRYMNPTAMRGTIGRNTFRKGAIRNVNAVLARSWKVAREYTVRFRAESINLFNTPQFADPERNFTSKTFGLITNTLNEGRTFHFTLQFDF